MLYHLNAFFRVTAALIIREIATRFGSSPGGYLWAFIEPIAYITLMALIFSAVSRVPPLGDSYFMFFATGILGFNFYRSLVGYLSSSVNANKALFNYPKTAPIDAVMSRTIVQTATQAIVTVIVLSAIYSTLRRPGSIDAVFILKSTFLATVLAMGVALFNIPAMFRFPLYEKIYKIMMAPLFFLSGVFYLPGNLPHPFREYILYNPLCHITMMFRMGFYPEYRAQGLDEAYAISFSFLVFFVGLTIFSMSRDTLRSSRS